MGPTKALHERENHARVRVLKILGFTKISGMSVSVLYHSDATSSLQVFLHIYISFRSNS